MLAGVVSAEAAAAQSGSEDKANNDDWWSSVPELTSDTFDDTISQNSRSLVIFSAPWCGHTRAMQPEYTKVSSQHPDLVYLVNCIDDLSLCSQYNIIGKYGHIYILDYKIQYFYTLSLSYIYIYIYTPVLHTHSSRCLF